MSDKKMFGFKATPKEIAEFRRNCMWFGADNSSKVTRDLIDAFNKACIRCRAKGEIMIYPFGLRTGVVSEVSTKVDQN